MRSLVVFMSFLWIGGLEAGEPGPAAIDFIEKVARGQLDDKPGGDTAMRAGTLREKRRSIQRRLERLEGDLRGGEFEVGAVERRGDLAAVLVRKVGGFDVGKYQVFPVAMVREGELWRAAPVLGSFENAVPWYEADLRRRAAELEEWMMRERVLERMRMLQEGSDRVRKQILATLDEEVAKNDEPGEVLKDFLQRCREGDRAGILGFLGGLWEELPADWEVRMAATNSAVDPEVNARWPWRLLSSDDVSGILLGTRKDEDSTILSYGFLDPALAAREENSLIQVLHFRMRRDEEGRWAIELPDALLKDSAAILFEDDGLDENLVARFPERLMARVEGEPYASFEKVREHFVTELKSTSFEGLVSRLDLAGEVQEARSLLGEAARLWWVLHSSNSQTFPVLIGSRAAEGRGVAVMQFFDAKAIGKLDFEVFYFREVKGGWLWTSGGEDDVDELTEWAGGEMERWAGDWKASLMAEASLLTEEVWRREDREVLTESEVRDFAEEWLDLFRKRDLRRIIGVAAVLDADRMGIENFLRDLAFEVSHGEVDEWVLENVIVKGGWAAMVISKEFQGERVRNFLPVIALDGRLRFLPELKFVLGGGRTREFLNQEAFRRLAKVVGRDEMRSLRGVFREVEGEE